jgi:hypothetical protein
LTEAKKQVGWISLAETESQGQPGGVSVARFEYQVCLVQNSRATFVNGRWQGRIPLNPDRSEEGLDSCLHIWDYLQQVGAAGWELVAVTDSAYESAKESQHFQLLYLKRAMEASTAIQPRPR